MPGPSTCVPDNTTTNTYTAVIDSTAPGATLTLSGAGETVNALVLTAGTLDIESSGSLNLTNQPAGVTDIPANAGVIVAGTFTTGGTTSALAQLQSVEGALTFSGQGTPATPLSITPGGGTLTNSGTVNLQQGSTVTVNGGLTNNAGGTINTGNTAGDTGDNALTITGVLTNNGTIDLNGQGDSLAADLTNAGTDEPERERGNRNRDRHGQLQQ